MSPQQTARKLLFSKRTGAVQLASSFGENSNQLLRSVITLFFYNIVFRSEAGYFYFGGDFRLKIFLRISLVTIRSFVHAICTVYCIYYMFRLLNCHCHWHGLVMNYMDMQYSMLTWLILFSYLFLSIYRRTKFQKNSSDL